MMGEEELLVIFDFLLGIYVYEFLAFVVVLINGTHFL